ncbi:hypothetical protein KIPB_006550 [Kipferlia bialata]|uniref:Tryptophan synthase beta chain-like PALP domain-containing protein n=1 Tax=Kipferlia bialata TaxID=797122 RepID=A0A9K3GJX2_9EUKA|nr:hypothetical protein KIPB_006550 [Kipferlia bialata]|eukprot:g6550.t1
MECMNPGSSVKDRIALSMINDMDRIALWLGVLSVSLPLSVSLSLCLYVSLPLSTHQEKQGIAVPGETTFIEATSGNTGIGLAMVCAARGYKLIVVMPSSMSVERRALMMIFGAEVVLSPAALGMTGAIDLVQSMVDRDPKCVKINQFINPANPVAHRENTGPEITKALEESGLTWGAFVAGVGTGGTLTGVTQHIRDTAKDKQVSVFAVEPASSLILSTGQKGPGGPGIMGIGAGFVPGVLDVTAFGEVITVTHEDALETARRMAVEEGVFCGMSAGANVWAAMQVAKRPEFTEHGHAVVTVVCDTGERYLSTPLFKGLMDKAAALEITH